MIDATKSPQPAWRRYATLALLGVLILVAGYVLWTKELHKSQAGSLAATPPAAAAARATTPAPATSKTTVTPSTTIPGGIAVSSRDPFAG